MEAIFSRLSSRHEAQLAFLELMPLKLQRIHTVVEEMASLRCNESVMRGLGHLLDEIKGNAAQVNLADLADTAGLMRVMLRGRGGVPLKVRGLRELLGSLRKSYDTAVRSATVPGREPSSRGGGAPELGR